MDLDRLDTLARSLAPASSRRRLLGLLGPLAAVPVVGGLADLLAPGEAAAKDRRRRRKQRHQRRKNPGARKHPRRRKCKAESVAQTCAGACGSVLNNCRKAVDCGSCDCTPPCAACFTCQGAVGAPGACVPQEAGTPCGAATTCASGAIRPQGACDGAGVCQPDTPLSCAPYSQCAGDACAASCANDSGCVAGWHCCGGTCQECCDHSHCATCQTCAGGACIAESSLDHTCDGPCPDGEWCDAGVCAAIAATVRLLDCQSLCSGSTEVCGQTVTCPSCNDCLDQTGCFSNPLQQGPLGPGEYCSISSNSSSLACANDAACAVHDPYAYCTTFYLCARMCPFAE